MTYVITSASLKAGCGKSELVKKLSKYLLEKDNRVLVIDTDINQPTVYKYFKEEFPMFTKLTCINISSSETKFLDNNFFKLFDYVIIDTTSNVQDLKMLFTFVDKIITPITLDSFTYNSLKTLQQLVNDFSTKVKSLDVITYINDAKYQHKVEILESIRDIEKLNVLNNSLYYYKSEDSLAVLEELTNNEYISS